MSEKINDKATLIHLLQSNAGSIKKYGVDRLGLFGSFVRNDMNEQSDVDLLVEFEPGKKTYKNFIHLAYFLEEICGRKVELVTPSGLSKYFGEKILKSTEYVTLAR